MRGFVSTVQPSVTHDVYAKCKDWIVGRPVRPDWEMAEETTTGGKHVVRVSMFGKSTTGFVETGPESWKADRVWCLPPAP